MLPIFAGYMAAAVIDGSVFGSPTAFQFAYMDITMMVVMGIPTVYGALIVFGVTRMVWTHNRKMGHATQ